MLQAIGRSSRVVTRATPLVNRVRLSSHTITRACGGRSAFHSCTVCSADSKKPASDEPSAANAGASAESKSVSGKGKKKAAAAIDFGSTEDVKLNVKTSEDADGEGEAGEDGGADKTSLGVMSAKRLSDEKLDESIPFDIKIPPRLHNHLASIDMFVKPQALDSEKMAELKAAIIAINNKIRKEVQMQPSEFYLRFYQPQNLSRKPDLDEIEKRERLFTGHPDHHPIYNDKSDFPDDGYLRTAGLDPVPNQQIFDLLGHTLPKPHPRKQPCLFCRPGRGHPPEYYKLDYTNVNLLHRFLDERGGITHRLRNHNCAKHQRKVAVQIKRARFIGLLSFSSLYHVPREFMNVSKPPPFDASIRQETINQLNHPNWGPRQTAAALATGTLKAADYQLWTAESGFGTRGVSRRRDGAVASAAEDGDGEAASAAAAEGSKKRDPNSLD